MRRLSHKVNARSVMDRLGALYSRTAVDQVFASFEIPSSSLDRFRMDHPDPFCDYPDPHERIRFWDRLLEERRLLEDDSIPSAYLSEFDQGLYGGLAGGEVRFMAHPENGWISSMVPPLLKDWSDIGSLTFSKSSPWWHRYLNQLEVFREGAEGKFGISHFILISSLNFVFELVGATNTYLALSENPDAVRGAIEFAFNLNSAVQDTYFEKVHRLECGTFSNMVQWIPGRIVSESVDPFHMTSVDCFEEWGRQPVQRMLDRFDGGVLHLHGNGRHLLEAVSTIKGLKAIHMGDDKGFVAAIEIVRELRERAGDLPLVVNVEYPAFLEKIRSHQLPGGILYKVQHSPLENVNHVMDRVREYRA